MTRTKEPDVIVVRAVDPSGEEDARRDRPAPWGWTLNIHPRDASHHILPTWDTAQHYLDDECACRPKLDTDGQFLHNAFDGRERYQQGLARHH